MVDNILSILDRVEENLDLSLTNERSAENQRIELFEELSAKLNGLIIYVQGQLASLATTIVTLKQKIGQSETALA